MTRWGWAGLGWVILLALAGGFATWLALQGQYVPLRVISIVGFPLGLLIPPNFQYWFFALGVVGGIENLPIVAPVLFGIALAICACLQVAFVRVVRERISRRRLARERAEELGKHGYSDTPTPQ